MHGFIEIMLAISPKSSKMIEVLLGVTMVGCLYVTITLPNLLP